MGLAAAGAVAGIAGGVAGVANAAGSLLGAGKASGAAQQSAFLQLQQQQQNQVNQEAFVNAGQYGAEQLQNQLASGQLGTPMNMSGQPTAAQVPQFSWNPTMAGLAQTPGYQFTLQQGLQAQQNSATARGLGVSGAQLRGAADYASGLASTTYNAQFQNALNQYQYGTLPGYTAQQGAFQNQFSDYWANQTNRSGMLQNLGTMGENAAAGAGSTGMQGAAQIGNATLAGGQAQGAGTQGAFNALSGVLSSPQTQTALTSLFGGNYGSSAPGTPGISAAGNPVMTGFASTLAPGQAGVGGFVAPMFSGGSTINP